MLTRAVEDDGEDFWAITCYFNPAGYRRRLANYRAFREGLVVPLVTVELAYGNDFDLIENDAEVLVQVRGKDVLWQKERLLNIALRALPDSCRKVVWLDCDVVFEAKDWAQRTSMLLDRFALVQPFSHVHRAYAEWHSGDLHQAEWEVRCSIPSIVKSGMPIVPGYAWAAVRELLDRHQLYDACVIGGGDSAILCAAYGCIADAASIQTMNVRQREHYWAWAQAFHEDCRAQVAFADGNLIHLWHGNKEHRRYLERYDLLTRSQFDPFEDIALDQNGTWRWNTDKTEMHADVRAYFASRREDG